MTTESTISFLSEVDEKLEIRIYGKKVHDFSIIPIEKSKLGAKTTFVKIYGIKALGICHKLSKPLLTILPGDGQVSIGCSDFDTKEFLMWMLPKEHPIVTFETQVTSIEEFINQEVKPLIDVDAAFGIHNLQVNGDTISGYLQARLKLHQKLPWPAKDINITVVDGNFPFSFKLANVCYPIYTVGVASAQLCISLNPNKICGEINFSVPLPFGLHFNHSFQIACVSF